MIQFFNDKRELILQQKTDSCDLPPFIKTPYSNQQHFPAQLPYFSPLLKSSPIFALYTPDTPLQNCHICLLSAPSIPLYCRHSICPACFQLVSLCPLCRRTLLVNAPISIRYEEAKLIKYASSNHLIMGNLEAKIEVLKKQFSVDEIKFFSQLNLIGSEFEVDRRALELVVYRGWTGDEFQHLREAVLDAKIELLNV
ncbi:hypothetical protein SS50377_20856 [Spironucleus salmonicida]|uniref:RING-type domain-containing protein n=1 Tax=Spironucleus salmonicida TaxID=348837 RepID=V6LRX6_9EUKA|nr:hypothetical protein SS50377_20856 [Spironucleus salmonicida]|eukprot:EST43534.1 Hypothetical protein SS50377_16569 [Spironucleus salmonicida]